MTFQGRLSIGLSVIFFLGLILFFTIPNELVATYVGNRVAEQMEPMGWQVKFNGPRLRFFGFSASSVAFVAKDLLVSFACEELDAGFPFKWPLSLHLTARCYEGDLQVAVERPLSSSYRKVQGSLQGLRLALHPQINGFGIRGGTLSGNLTPFQVNGPQANFSLSVRQLNAEEQKLPLLKIKVPAIYDGTMLIRGLISSSELALKQVEVRSNLASFDGAGSAVFFGASSVDAEGKLQIRQEGRLTLSPLLQLASGSQKESNSYTFTIKGSLKKPQVKVTATD